MSECGYYNWGCVCIGRSNPLKVGFAKDYKKACHMEEFKYKEKEMSTTCSVRRLLSSVWIHALRVSSVMKIWAALANRTGASALIICTVEIVLHLVKHTHSPSIKHQQLHESLRTSVTAGHIKVTAAAKITNRYIHLLNKDCVVTSIDAYAELSGYF